MKYFPLLPIGTLVLLVLSPVRAETTVIRAFDGVGSDIAYSGGSGNGWLTGWETAVRTEPEEVRGTLTHVTEGSVVSEPQLGELPQHLIFEFSTPQVAGQSAKQINYALGRRYEARDLAGEVQTVRFLFRLDNFSGFTKPTDYVGAFGGAGRGTVQPNTNPDTTWYVRARGDTKTWWIGRGGHEDPRNWEDTSVPFEIGTTYEVIITHHLGSNSYDVKIGDDFEMKDIACIRNVPTNPAGPMWVQFHAQADRIGEDGQLAIGGLRISGE